MTIIVFQYSPMCARQGGVMDNKKNRLALIGALAIAVLGATAYFAYDLFESRREAAAAEARAAVRAAEQRAKAQAKAEREQQIRAFKNLALSPWLEQGLAPLQSALTKSNARVLVLPPSNPEDKAGLDLSARIAFARTLADDLTSPSAGLIPDP